MFKCVYNYPHALRSIPNCYVTHKMCDKAVNTHTSKIQCVRMLFLKILLC